MIKMFAVGLLSTSVLSGCASNYFSLPDKFDICGISIGELDDSHHISDDMIYIKVGWCSQKGKEDD